MNPISNTKSPREEQPQHNSPSSNSAHRKAAAAWIDLIPLVGGDGDEFGVCTTFSAMLLPGKAYTVGRSERGADFVFSDPRVSKQHCQILFDGFLKKLYLLNGALLIDCSCDNFDHVGYVNCVVNEFRSRLSGEGKIDSCSSNCRYVYRGCLNGVFVNGVKVNEGCSVELCVGDEVLLVCGNRNGDGGCGGLRSRIGFVVRRVVFHEEIVKLGFPGFWCKRPILERRVLGGNVHKRVFALSASYSESLSYEYSDVVSRAKSLLACCIRIARSNDPISCIRKCKGFKTPIGGSYSCMSKKRKTRSFEVNGNVSSPRKSVPPDNAALMRQQPIRTSGVLAAESSRAVLVQSANVEVSSEGVLPLIPSAENLCTDGSSEKDSFSFEVNGNANTLGESLQLENVTIMRPQLCETLVGHGVASSMAAVVQSTTLQVSCETMVHRKPNLDICLEGCGGAGLTNENDYKTPELVYVDGKCSLHCGAASHKVDSERLSPPGKNFYLNRLEGIPQCSSEQDKVVSLPELLHPIDSISRMFIATLSCDIGWFLSYCDVPCHLPVTIACHDSERCWSSDPGNRSCVPNPDFPNLVVVYPPFPESIAFGKDRKNKGVGCHHPKLFVLQREDSLRVIVTSANLVAKQWKSVTNTVWWQDFPRRDVPDCISLFNQLNEVNRKGYPASDFAAQLAGFMAKLVNDVPSQAHWIFELTKYDYTGADVYLVASVPGIHSYRSISEASLVFKSKCGGRFLGSVSASVVGLSHRFRRAADSNGAQLKKLAAYLAQSSGQRWGMTEVVLRREKNLPQDTNAVSVHVSNPRELYDGDYVQLGFLPRTVAKWVSPLWDIGFFTFQGYLCLQEALAAASGESNIIVQLILCVSQGVKIQNITKMMKPEHVVAFCSLIASVQRCTGLWRLEEVLNRYKWPEHLESEFIYGASSIGGSVGAQFLASFAAAAGKRSLEAYDSQESDPEWGCWNAGHELKHPSMRILFPTIERVKSSNCGILPSKHILSFTEKTWQKLKTVDILHDAIPHPSSRVGHPMHVKVARRRFRSQKGDSSWGWVYSGSHNMSAAAWGRTISSQSEGPVSGRDNGNSSSLRLHVCNYELGIIYVFPLPDTKDSSRDNSSNLDDINLPFVVPAPKYGPRDKPATMRAMWEALAESAALEGNTVTDVASKEEIAEEDVDEEDEVVEYVVPEAEEEKAYADVLWHHVDSSQSS